MWRFERVRVRPTLAGAGYLALVAGITFGAVNTGNNLVYMVLALLLGVLLLSNVLAEWNLRGLQVERVLPPELFAGRPADGHYAVRNPRARGSAWKVEITEVDGSGRGLLEHCPPGARVEVPARFCLPARGLRPLGRLRLSSRFPFGLFVRMRDVELPTEVLVYPAARRGLTGAMPSGSGDVVHLSQVRADVGEFAGLRPYQSGDPVRRVHWPTSARVGAPMIVLRTGESGEEVLVRVEAGLRGEAREEAIARAAGQVEHHLRRGDAVGMEADGESQAPRTGASWRRALLTRLALLETRP